MAVALSPLSLQTFFDINGLPIRTAKLFVYNVGTLDSLTVYQDQALSVPHPQPISVGGSGRVPPIYVGEVDYRVRVVDDGNVLIEDIPFLPAAVDLGTIPAPAPDTALLTGDVIWSFNNSNVRAGWVRMNGGTIGSASSGASERANADTQALFLHLWGQDAAGLQLTVSGGRGASAAADWAANKAISLPDGRGRDLRGLETMGRTSANLLTGGTFTSGDGSKLGSYGGAATATLTLSQTPSHSHTVSITDPGHNHIATQTAHNHTINIIDYGHGHVLNDPGHFHQYQGLTYVGGTGDWPQNGGSTRPLPVNTDLKYTGITMNNAFTGISATSNNTQPNITMQNATTGISASTGSQGGGAAHNNLPPFLLGCFYMRL
jgi:microcystin-dependent protein